MSHFAHLKLLTKADAADILGVCTKTVDNYIRDGLLPPPRPLGSREYWHPKVFERFLDEHFGLTERPREGPAVEGDGVTERAEPPQGQRGREPRSTKQSSAARQAARQASVLRGLNA